MRAIDPGRRSQTRFALGWLVDGPLALTNAAATNAASDAVWKEVEADDLQANGLRQASPGQARNERRPGICRTKWNKPQRGAANHASIPHVSFIYLDAMFPAKRTELILIRHPAMMLLLRRDIGPDLLDVRLAHGK